MRTATPALPDLAPALHRLLQELRSARDGLGFTERLILRLLSDSSMTVRHQFGALTFQFDPLPFVTDLMLLYLIERMQRVSEPVLIGSGAADVWQDTLTITAIGRKVIRGEMDFMSLRPTARWVGGVEVSSGAKAWRWNEMRMSRDAVLM